MVRVWRTSGLGRASVTLDVATSGLYYAHGHIDRNMAAAVGTALPTGKA
jgi:hypothetical protein